MEYLRRLIFVLVIWHSTAWAESIKLIAFYSPPLVNEEANSKVGDAYETVISLFQRSGIHFNIDYSPEARAIKSARLVDNVCSFPVARSQLLEAEFRWVGPIAISQYALYQQQLTKLELLSLQDASPYQIVAYEGYSIAQQLKEQGFKIMMTKEVDDGLRMLRRSGIDLWLSDTRTAMTLSDELEIELANHPFVFLTDVKYLACNTSVSEEQIYHLQQVIDQMIMDGEMLLLPAVSN